MRPYFDGPWFLPVFVLMLFLTYELGYRIALRQKTSPLYKGRPIESAIMGLLSLLLGFTFNQAGMSYRERLSLVHEESDCIAHVYRLSEFLPKEDRRELRQQMIQYLEAKTQGLSEDDAVRLHGKIYAFAMGHHQKKTLTETESLAFLQAINRMIQLHFRGSYSRNERVPIVVIGLLVIGSWSIGLMVGFASGVNERRSWVVPLVFFFLISGTLATIRDLDDPYGGWIRVDFSNLKDLLRILQRLRTG